MLKKSIHLSLCLGSLTFALAYSGAHAREPAPAASMTTTSNCQNDYDVVGSVYDDVEMDSIDSQEISTEEPFECVLVDDEQTVDFSFNGEATDPLTDCTYSLTRTDESTSSPLGPSITLDLNAPSVDYELVATPKSNDPDCEGIQAHTTGPKVRISVRQDPDG